MKSLLIVFLFLSTEPLLAQVNTQLPSIVQILQGPEDSIDVGLADLVLASDFYPDLKIESFLFTFNYLANRFNYFFGQYSDPDQKVRALNTFLYKKGEWNDSITFAYDDDDLHVTKLSNKFINGFLATKKGSCITLPMMYMILGERLGLPIYASRLPYHFFVRYLPETKISNFQKNIEATNGGSFVADSEYKQTFLVPDKPVNNGVYLRTLSKKEYLASILLVNADEWIARKNLDKAKYYLELSMKYDSTFSSAMMNYATLHLHEAMLLEQKMNDEKQTEIAFYDICTKNKARNPTPPSPQLPSPLQQTFRLPEPDFSAFQIRIEDNVTKTNKPNQSQPTPQLTALAKLPSNLDLQASVSEITQRYVPLIQAKVRMYQEYKQKAEELGIVRDYPMSFFQIQSKSLKQFQEKRVK